MKLSLADVVRLPRPGTVVPGGFAFAADGRSLSFLRAGAGSLARELWSLDLATGVETRVLSLEDVGGGASEAQVSLEEALRRERERLLEGGITHYQRAARAEVMLAPVGGALWVVAAGGARVVARDASAAGLSADGARVVFVRDGDLHVVAAVGGEELRLTHDAAPGLSNGLAEFIAAEEMDRHEGFWISPDGRRVAYAQVDERHIPLFRIAHLASAADAGEEHRYPFAGAANARVRLGIVSRDGGTTRWLDLGGADYLARVDWSRGGDLLYVQLQPRDQRSLELRAYDPATGEARSLLVERTTAWINLHHDFRSLASGDFLWASERSGAKHLYLYRGDQLVRQLTAGPWPVDEVVAVDTTHVSFAAGRESPLERQLYRVPLAGGEVERLSAEPGWHQAVYASDGSRSVRIHDSRSRPPRVRVGDRVLHEAEAIDLAPPEFLEVLAADGATRLHGALWRARAATAPAPLVVGVYGGPHVQLVQDTWALTVALRAQYLAQQGYAVFMLDNRGSSRRGLAFESAIAGRLGTVEVDDQVAGVRHLVRLGIADANRVGIYGWSYGGYLVLRCLAFAPEVFRAGVAGAPNADLEGYDTHWTERYMLGTPAERAEAYRECSVLAHAAKIRGKLLVVHGLLDENVHFRHSARLIDALIRAGVEHEQLLLPHARHSLRDERDRLYLERRVEAFFARHLSEG